MRLCSIKRFRSPLDPAKLCAFGFFLLTFVCGVLSWWTPRREGTSQKATWPEHSASSASGHYFNPSPNETGSWRLFTNDEGVRGVVSTKDLSTSSPAVTIHKHHIVCERDFQQCAGGLKTNHGYDSKHGGWKAKHRQRADQGLRFLSLRFLSPLMALKVRDCVYLACV